MPIFISYRRDFDHGLRFALEQLLARIGNDVQVFVDDASQIRRNEPLLQGISEHLIREQIVAVPRVRSGRREAFLDAHLDAPPETIIRDKLAMASVMRSWIETGGKIVLSGHQGDARPQDDGARERHGINDFLEDAINESSCIVVLWSVAGRESNLCREIINSKKVDGDRRVIIPVRSRDCIPRSADSSLARLRYAHLFRALIPLPDCAMKTSLPRSSSKCFTAVPGDFLWTNQYAVASPRQPINSGYLKHPGAAGYLNSIGSSVQHYCVRLSSYITQRCLGFGRAPSACLAFSYSLGGLPLKIKRRAGKRISSATISSPLVGGLIPPDGKPTPGNDELPVVLESFTQARVARPILTEKETAKILLFPAVVGFCKSIDNPELRIQWINEMYRRNDIGGGDEGKSLVEDISMRGFGRNIEKLLAERAQKAAAQELIGPCKK